MIEEDNPEYLDAIAKKRGDIGVKTSNQKEYKLQVHIVKKHALYFPHVIMSHIPGRPSDAADAFFKKQMGVLIGISDLVVCWSHQYPNWATRWLAKMLSFLGFSFAKMHTGFIELKVDSPVSPAQNKFLSAIHSLGGYQGVARSWQQYYKLLCSWGIKPVEECHTFDEPNYASDTEKYKAAHDWYKP